MSHPASTWPPPAREPRLRRLWRRWGTWVVVLASIAAALVIGRLTGQF